MKYEKELFRACVVASPGFVITFCLLGAGLWFDSLALVIIGALTGAASVVLFALMFIAELYE